MNTPVFLLHPGKQVTQGYNREITQKKKKLNICENQKLREELKQIDERLPDEQNVRVLRDLLNTVQQLQQDRDNSRKRRLPTKSQRKNVQDPSTCRVNTTDIFLTVVRLPVSGHFVPWSVRSKSDRSNQ